MKESKQNLLKSLPKIDEYLEKLSRSSGVDSPRRLIKNVIQNVVAMERNKILSNPGQYTVKTSDEWLELFRKHLSVKETFNLRRVINGTGVVVHTNLGRSILSEKTADCLIKASGFYTNLEFNLETGKRGSRYSLVEEIVCDLTGAEAAIVVNNNAAAVLITLETLAAGKEVIVSRGQLVEIGGSFRIPDVMKKSGAFLVEVGTTNRTHLRDYERAIGEETAMLLRVHTSNFKIIGFTSDVAAHEMVDLARTKGLLTMEDLGSGSLIDFSEFGFPKEPTVQEIVKAGVDVVTFSGDKLLGGPQAGIIVGKKDVIEKIKANPLNRALRIDKFTLSSLESVLREYYDTSRALQNIPTLAMLTISSEILKKRAQKIKRRLQKTIRSKCSLQIVPIRSMVGGGALPEHTLASWAVELQPLLCTINSLEKGLRLLELPIIGRIENDRFFLDVRTIQECEIDDLVGSLRNFFDNGEGNV